MVLHLSSGVPPEINELGLSRVMRIVELAEQNGINVAFENLRTIEHLDYILDNITSPRAGFCYDSGHHNYCMPDTDLLSKYGSSLLALHLHNNDGSDDQHRLPFDGTINWPEVMKKNNQIGYKGSVALEPENTGYKELPPGEFLRLAAERALKLESLMYDM